ncbi:acyl-CoA dehydrogenase family protein [Amycolatopsis sp. NPDC059090]|uniref:acyl-CoA dehydrogenase family protein n=1 Tax=unclassified Amycolatopsis TaxID=2618356 RepID=UPI00366F7C85
MRQCLTERQRLFVRMAEELAEKFAPRAAGHDTDNTFPVENYEDMRESGFLRLSVPGEFGGFGATQAEILPALERLAMGDGATALAVTMHISPLGQWAAVWRRTGSEKVAEILRLAGADKLVWASLGAEAGAPNRMSDARSTAVKVDGGYLVNGRKTFGTNTAVATHCSTTARLEDAEGGPRLMLFCVALDDPAVRIHPTWDVMGMRGTQSNDVEFADLFVPDDAVLHSLPVGHLDGHIVETVFAWSMPAFGAVYTGVALGALEWVKAQAAGRGRTTDPLVQNTIGECEILVETSRSVLSRHAADYGSRALFDQLSVQESLARSAFAKYVCVNNAARVVDLLVEVAGGAGYSRRLPFERMWRDVRAGLIMPLSNQPARQLIGQTSFGIETAPTVAVAEPAPEPATGLSAVTG